MSEDVVLGKPVLNPSPKTKFARTELEAAQHPLSIALMECWLDHEVSGGMRMGRDIPSRALSKLLPHVLITEPIGSWDDARVRLAGTALIERFGRDVAGATVSQLYVSDPEGGKLLLRLGRRAVETRKPGLLDTRIFTYDIEAMHLEIVMFPIFSPDGEGVWNLVGAFKF